MTPEEKAAWAAESRAKQGLPPGIENPAILARIAAIVEAALRGRAGGPEVEATEPRP